MRIEIKEKLCFEYTILKMPDLVKCVSMLLAITIATGEINNSKGKQKQKDLNHISDQSDLLLAPRSNFGILQLPNFVGFDFVIVMIEFYHL